MYYVGGSYSVVYLSPESAERLDPEYPSSGWITIYLIFFIFLSLLSSWAEEVRKLADRYQRQKLTNHKLCTPQEDTPQPEVKGQSTGRKYDITKLHEYDLNCDLTNHDHNEDPISPNPIEDVALTMDLTSIDFIEDLEHDKCVEDDGEMLRWICPQLSTHTTINIEQHRSGKENHHQYGELVERMTCQEHPHLFRDERFFASVWFSFEQIGSWRFSGKSEGRKCVHDQVHPE